MVSTPDPNQCRDHSHTINFCGLTCTRGSKQRATKRRVLRSWSPIPGNNSRELKEKRTLHPQTEERRRERGGGAATGPRTSSGTSRGSNCQRKGRDREQLGNGADARTRFSSECRNSPYLRAAGMGSRAPPRPADAPSGTPNKKKAAAGAADQHHQPVGEKHGPQRAARGMG